MEKILKNLRYRLKYHIMGKQGWINDPNGMIYFKGYYHVFFQHSPHDSKWGPMHWGHVRSKDLIHWENLPIALFPEAEDGCFSGSAIEHDGKLFLLYTAHHELKGEVVSVVQEQNLAYSEDGINFVKYEGNPVIKAPMLNNTADFRDPKIWSDGHKFYCVIGGQTLDKRGQVLVYESDDIYHWNFKQTLAQASEASKEGYMWECPDYFEINGQKILIISPQGIKEQDERFNNLFQCGYFIGREENGKLTYQPDSFQELDYGHDFYAAQTLLAPDGRRILIAWMAMWEQDMPEQVDGWAGCMTFPRELIIKDDQIFMRPVRELALLEQEVILEEILSNYQMTYANRSLEIETFASEASDFDLTLSYGESDLNLSYQNGKLFLTKTGYPSRVFTRTLKTTNFKILCDTSSVEIFFEEGPVFSERLYGVGETKLKFNSVKPLKMKVTSLEL